MIYRNFNSLKFNKRSYIQDYYLDKDNNAVVKIVLENVQKAFSPFSPKGFEELDLELAEYIDSIIYNIPLANPVVLQFELPSATKEEQALIQQVVKAYYSLRLEDKKLDQRINRMKIWGLIAVGCIFLMLSYLMASNNIGQLFTDCMSIAATFALWEAVDLSMLERENIKLEKLNAAQTASAKIVFISIAN